MTNVTRFPSLEAMQKLVEMGMEEGIRSAMGQLDGVMMGRAAYQEPWRLLAVDATFFGEPAPFASGKDAARARQALAMLASVVAGSSTTPRHGWSRSAPTSCS